MPFESCATMPPLWCVTNQPDSDVADIELCVPANTTRSSVRLQSSGCLLQPCSDIRGVLRLRRADVPEEGQPAEEQDGAHGDDGPDAGEGESPDREPRGEGAGRGPAPVADEVEQAGGAGHEGGEGEHPDDDRRGRCRPDHGQDGHADQHQRRGALPTGLREPPPEAVVGGLRAHLQLARAGVGRRDGKHGTARDDQRRLDAQQVRDAPEHGPEHVPLELVATHPGGDAAADVEQRELAAGRARSGPTRSPRKPAADPEHGPRRPRSKRGRSARAARRSSRRPRRPGSRCRPACSG